MALKDILFGKGGEYKALPTMGPEQQQLLGQLLGGLQGPLGMGLQNLQSMLGGEAGAYEAPAMRQFQEQILPMIAERFTGAGAQRSSAFGQQLGQAGAGFAENLAMQRAQLQQQGLSQLSGLLGMGIQTPTFQWGQMPGTEGFLGHLLKGVGGGIGGIGGSWLGGGLMGALTPGVRGFGGGVRGMWGL